MVSGLSCSPKPSASLVAALLLGACCLLAGGCSVKRNLDARVDQILTALQRQDRALLSKIMQEQLYEQISPEVFAKSALMVKALGPLKDRRMSALWLSSDGGTKATYVLTFAKGTLEMRLEQQGDRISALAWGGQGFEQAQAQLAAKGFGRLLVREIALLDSSGAPRAPSVFSPQETIHFRVKAKGLAVEQGRAHLALSLMVVNELGKAVVDEPRFAEKELRLAPTDPPVSQIEGELPALKPGAYSFQATVIDLVRQATAEEKVVLKVVAGAEEQAH